MESNEMNEEYVDLTQEEPSFEQVYEDVDFESIDWGFEELSQEIKSFAMAW